MLLLVRGSRFVPWEVSDVGRYINIYIFPFYRSLVLGMKIFSLLFFLSLSLSLSLSQTQKIMEDVQGSVISECCLIVS